MTSFLASIADAAPALAMIAVFALAIAGVRMIVKGGDRSKAALMLVCAAVMLANVMIWTL